jgi:hypothetical protein
MIQHLNARPTICPDKLVPAKEFLAISVPDVGIDVVVVEDGAEVWVREDSPVEYY